MPTLSQPTRPRTLSRALGLLLLIAGACGRSSPAFGEAVGSPTHLEKGQWDMELRGSGVHERDMKSGAVVSVYGVGHRRGYGLTDRLSLYGNIGVAHLRITDGTFPKGVGEDFGPDLLVDMQVKGILWQNARKDWTWDGSAQYVYVGAPHKRKGNKATWKEWQLATCLAKSFGPLKPYAGVKASLVSVRYRAHGDLVSAEGTYKPDGVVGPVFGLDWLFGENQDDLLNVELSYIAGPDIAVTVTKRF